MFALLMCEPVRKKTKKVFAQKFGFISIVPRNKKREKGRKKKKKKKRRKKKKAKNKKKLTKGDASTVRLGDLDDVFIKRNTKKSRLLSK